MKAFIASFNRKTLSKYPIAFLIMIGIAIVVTIASCIGWFAKELILGAARTMRHQPEYALAIYIPLFLVILVLTRRQFFRSKVLRIVNNLGLAGAAFGTTLLFGAILQLYQVVMIWLLGSFAKVYFIPIIGLAYILHNIARNLLDNDEHAKLVAHKGIEYDIADL